MITLIDAAGTSKKPQDFSLAVLTEHIHETIPETIDRTLSIPGRDGLFYFGSNLNVRQFEIPFLVKPQANKMELQNKLRQFASFLMDGYGKPKQLKLFFDYEPDKFYSVRLVGRIVPERILTLATFTLSLVADNPYAQYIVPSDEITMGSDIPIMSDILWGTGLSDFVITSPQTLTIVNNGTQVIRLSYLLEGSGNNVAISANGKSFSLGSFTSANWEVNGETYIIKKNGVTDLTSMSGDFIELLPGINEVQFSGSNLNLTFSEQMIYKYM